MKKNIITKRGKGKWKFQYTITLQTHEYRLQCTSNAFVWARVRQIKVKGTRIKRNILLLQKRTEWWTRMDNLGYRELELKRQWVSKREF